MKLPQTPRIAGDGWTFGLGDGRNAAFVLSDQADRAPRAEFGFAELNGLTESDALLAQNRFHERAGGVQTDWETVSVYPFGGEARLERSWTVRSGLLECCMDVKPGRGEAVRRFALGSITLYGAWQSARIVRQLPAPGKPWQWNDLPLDAETLSLEKAPFVVLVLTDDAGRQIELGSGGDWWRLAAALPGNTPEWRIRKTADAVMVERTVIAFPDDAELERRPWRFNTFVAWHDGSPEFPCPNAELVPMLDLGCRRAPAVRKLLKKTLRQAAETANAGPLVWQMDDPVSCLDSGHLERPGKGALAHWDLDELFALYRWGTRLLTGKRDFRIALSADSPWRNTPAGRYLASVPGSVFIQEQ